MRVLRSPLAGLGDLVTRSKVKSPALIVIGEVAAEPADEPLKSLALEALQ
jgi:uroporphyrin-III C-methyltransferase